MKRLIVVGTDFMLQAAKGLVGSVLTQEQYVEMVKRNEGLKKEQRQNTVILSGNEERTSRVL